MENNLVNILQELRTRVRILIGQKPCYNSVRLWSNRCSDYPSRWLNNIGLVQNNAFNTKKISSECQVHLNQLGAKRDKWAVNSQYRTGINGKRKKEEEDKGRMMEISGTLRSINRPKNKKKGARWSEFISTN